MGRSLRFGALFFSYLLLSQLVVFSGSPASATTPPTVTAVERVDGAGALPNGYDGVSYGPVAGGTDVEIKGTGFLSVDTVKIGGDTLTKVADNTPHGTLQENEWSYQTALTPDTIFAVTPQRADANLWVGSQQVVVAASGVESTDEIYWEYRPAFQTVNGKVISLGDLASRTQAQPVTTTTGSAPYTVFGTDSRSGLAYSFETDEFYDPTDNSEGAGWSREGQEIVPDSWNGTSFTSGSYFTRQHTDTNLTQVVLESELDCGNNNPNNDAPAGVDPVSNGEQDGTTKSYCSIFGPEVFTEPFRATDSQALAFNWKAVAGDDDYEIYAFLVAVSDSTDTSYTDADHTVLAYGRGEEQSTFKTQASDIPSTGLYKFRFVNGSYDGTGGKALGARMYIQRAVTVGLKNVITFTGPGDQIASGGVYADITVEVTTTSGAQATLTAGGASSCSTALSSFSRPTTTFTISSSSAGACVLTASAGASGSYAPASDVVRTFNYRAAATTPSAPTITSITGGAGSVSVTFTPPTSNGGATITNYQYTIDGTNYIALSPADGSSPITISGLTLGTSYNFRIKAVNSVGAGPASNQVTGAPTSAAPVTTSASPNNTVDEEIVVAAPKPPVRVNRASEPVVPQTRTRVQPRQQAVPEVPSPQTLDLGEGLQEGGNISFGQDVLSNAVRTPRQLASEKLSGFLPSAAATVEVIGSITGSRFLVTPGTSASQLLEILGETSGRSEAELFRLAELNLSAAPETFPDLDSESDEVARVFSAAGLPIPSLLTPEFSEERSGEDWIELSGLVQGFAPGSKVFLVANSEPLVVGYSEVGLDGGARLSGSVPVSWFKEGEHHIRAVGVRSFDGIQVAADGSVVLPDAVIDEVERFDLGTQATVLVSAMNTEFGTHTAVRVIPLEPTAPWWTLLILLIVAGLTLWARRAGHLQTMPQRLVGGLAVLTSALPGIILGWTSTVVAVSVWAFVLGVIATVVVILTPEARKAGRA